MLQRATCNDADFVEFAAFAEAINADDDDPWNMQAFARCILPILRVIDVLRAMTYTCCDSFKLGLILYDCAMYDRQLMYCISFVC